MQNDHSNDGPFSSADLPIFDGRVYHLILTAKELAPDILIVGDPGRVSLIAKEFLYEGGVEKFHRGLRTVTGNVKETGALVTVTTSGMGTPSLEIVLGEIATLNEINSQTRKRMEEFPMVNIVRIGTSGGLQADTPLCTPIIAAYAVGLDNTGLFYDAPLPDENCGVLERNVEGAIRTATLREARYYGKIHPYAAKATPEMVAALEAAAQELGITYKKGVTISNAGFFANQGRDIMRVRLTVPNIDKILAQTETGIQGLKFENMEMEASLLFHLMYGLGYNVGAISPAIANRVQETFDPHYEESVKDSTRVALRALYAMRQKNK